MPETTRLATTIETWWPAMGLNPGHVTNPAIGLTRNEQLKALGNGVCPQQSAAATRALLTDLPLIRKTPA